MCNAIQTVVDMSVGVRAMARLKAETIPVRRAEGFTLIEIMIVVAIIGILSAIAYPSYQQYVIRGNRTEGMALLNDAAARQERFYAQNNSYVTSQGDIAKLVMPNTSGTAVLSATGLYSLTVSGTDGYTFTAAPQGRQAADTKCKNLTLNAAGAKGASASGADVNQCWR